MREHKRFSEHLFIVYSTTTPRPFLAIEAVHQKLNIYREKVKPKLVDSSAVLSTFAGGQNYSAIDEAYNRNLNGEE